jgi:aspartyl-tRNA(Asn)/glutamyl-tRNA(Gln) amidotransferase subunit A
LRAALRPLPQLVRELASGSLTSLALVEDCLAAVRRCDGELHALLCVDAEGALAAAREADARRREERTRGPLDGIPYVLKDNIVTRGLPTTCGSRILEGFVSPYEATLVTRLREAGCILLGKTNLDEFGMGSSTEHSAFGPTRNPHDLSRVAGGSSGGSCAAIACGMAPLAFGSDTGGSVRLPAAFCGVVGLKPSYGRVSRYGLVAFASSLDQIGPVTRTVAGTALALGAVAGRDARDATTGEAAVPDYAAATALGVRGIRVGICPDLLGEGVDPAVREAVAAALRVLESLGCTVREVSLPHVRYGIAAYYLGASAEASSNLARFDGVRYGRRAETESISELYARSRREGFGDEVKRRIMLGTFALSAGYHDAYYGRAQRARRRIAGDYEKVFADVDVLVSPTSPTTAFSLGERLDDPLAMYLSDALTIPASLAGIPALSLPCGMTAAGLPVGLQLEAPRFAEETLFRVGAAFEEAAGGATPPALAAAETT